MQLPLFGPSNVRDSVGKVAGMVTNPTIFLTGGVAAIVIPVSSGLGLVDARAKTLGATESLEHNSLDYYATLRSVTAQHRAAFVTEGRAGDITAHEDAASPPTDVIEVVPNPAGASGKSP